VAARWENGKGGSTEFFQIKKERWMKTRMNMTYPVMLIISTLPEDRDLDRQETRDADRVPRRGGEHDHRGAAATADPEHPANEGRKIGGRKISEVQNSEPQR